MKEKPKTTQSMESSVARNVGDALELLSKGTRCVLDAVAPDDDTPGVIDDQERLDILRILEDSSIRIDAARETLIGGNAQNKMRELARIGAEVREHLTAREMQVLTLVATGSSNKEIASKLIISLSTADSHRANIAKKLHDILGYHPRDVHFSRCARVAGAFGETEWLEGLL